MAHLYKITSTFQSTSLSKEWIRGFTNPGKLSSHVDLLQRFFTTWVYQIKLISELKVGCSQGKGLVRYSDSLAKLCIHVAMLDTICIHGLIIFSVLYIQGLSQSRCTNLHPTLQPTGGGRHGSGAIHGASFSSL